MSEDAAVRARAIDRLERDTGPDSVELLSDLAEADQDPTVRGRAVEALGRLGTEEALFTLESALTDEDQGVRVRAVRALGGMGSPEALQIVGEALLESEDTAIRDAAAAVLQDHDSELARALLEAASQEQAARRVQVPLTARR